MNTRPIALTCAALILISLFLPWLEAPFGGTIVPWDVLSEVLFRRGSGGVGNMTFGLVVYLGSFVMAAVLLGTGMMRVPPRAMVLLTGALPVGLVLWMIIDSKGKGGLEGIGIGAWAWIGSAVVLLVAGAMGRSVPTTSA